MLGFRENVDKNKLVSWGRWLRWPKSSVLSCITFDGEVFRLDLDKLNKCEKSKPTKIPKDGSVRSRARRMFNEGYTQEETYEVLKDQISYVTPLLIYKYYWLFEDEKRKAIGATHDPIIMYE